MRSVLSMPAFPTIFPAFRDHVRVQRVLLFLIALPLSLAVEGRLQKKGSFGVD